MSKILMCIALSLTVASQEAGQVNPDDTSVASIEKILTEQVQSWNNKDIDGFMATYWNSPKLTFSGGGKTTRGWKATLERYKTKYPPEKMGTLNFDGLEVSVLSPQVAMVLGNWHLKWPEKPDAKGNFSLVLKKINNQWKIIHDHSSTLEE